MQLQYDVASKYWVDNDDDNVDNDDDNDDASLFQLRRQRRRRQLRRHRLAPTTTTTTRNMSVLDDILTQLKLADDQDFDGSLGNISFDDHDDAHDGISFFKKIIMSIKTK